MSEPDTYELFNRGKHLMAEGHNHQAALILEKASAREPEKASIREAFARALFNSGQTSRAEDEFKKALELDPADHYSHFGLGLCQAKRGDIPSAIGHLKIAIAMRPDSEDYGDALRKLSG